jgi:DNA-binding MarR family transcriptional regulator
MDNQLDFTGIPDTFYLTGLLSAFSNRFQACGDAFSGTISWKQCFLMICIDLFTQPPTIGELADAAGCSHQNVKQLLVKLQKVGYVELRPDEQDRRKLRVFILPAGREFQREHDLPSREIMEKLFCGITPEDLAVTIRTIETLNQVLEEHKK